MQTKLPDEQGWYWVHRIFDNDFDTWEFAHVNTATEKVTFFDGDIGDRVECASFEKLENKPAEWHGPFECPGGDFHSTTIVIDDELRKKAEQERKAICLTHADFSDCEGEGGGYSVTVAGLYSREEATKLIHGQQSISVDPGLLAACEAMLGVFIEERGNTVIIGHRLPGAVEQLRAAVAKAKSLPTPSAPGVKR